MSLILHVPWSQFSRTCSSNEDLRAIPEVCCVFLLVVSALCASAQVLPAGIATDERLPLIVVGAGKTLQLRNVVISSAASLPSCLHLGPGALMQSSKADNVACCKMLCLLVSHSHLSVRAG